MLIIRFANSLVYYGLSLNTGSLVGNPHFMLFLSGIIEIPGYIISFKFIDVLGRRPVIIFCFFLGGLTCMCTAYFPQSRLTNRIVYRPYTLIVALAPGSSAWTTATICVAMLGKSLIAVSFSIIYNYTAELFPTVYYSFYFTHSFQVKLYIC